MLERVRRNISSQEQPSRKKILILDDEPYNIEVLKSILSVLNLRDFPDSIDCCFDARKALILVRDSMYLDPVSGMFESNYALILSDLNMPIMDGYTFAKRVKSLFSEFKIQNQPNLVAITGNVEYSYLKRCFDC